MLQNEKTQAEAELQQTQALNATCHAEMTEIENFLDIVAARCDHLLSTFTESQEARATELENLQQARNTLQGMVESDAGVAAFAQQKTQSQTGSQGIATHPKVQAPVAPHSFSTKL